MAEARSRGSVQDTAGRDGGLREAEADLLSRERTACSAGAPVQEEAEKSTNQRLTVKTGGSAGQMK